MNFKSLFTTTALLSLCMFSLQVLASGGDSSSDDSNEDPFEGLSNFSREKVVDPTYESGKSTFTGRNKSTAKLSFCIIDGQEVLKVKRKTIKKFKNSSYSELAKNLYQCDVPTSSIKSQLASKDFLHVLYYLNKRYKLNLQRS